MMMRLAVVWLVVSAIALTGCTADSTAPAPDTDQVSPTFEPSGDCLPASEAARASLDGTPVWARFCRGPKNMTAPAQVPSDMLLTHLGNLDALQQEPKTRPVHRKNCSPSLARTYRLQIGYSDGTVAMVSGRTDPGCAGHLQGSSKTIVRGPEGLGVYGLAMAAFGKQYADAFPAAPQEELACPTDPRDPGSVEVDGTSVTLDTGFELGRRFAMSMPLTGVRGIECTWLPDEATPTVFALSSERAERVRIGLNAINNAIADCQNRPERPTTTAVIEDKTGTRRAITIIGPECDTVLQGDGGRGLGFAWLTR